MFKFERALEAVTYYLAEFLYDIKLIEAEEKEESKKTEKCTLSAQQICSAYTASFSFDDHDYMVRNISSLRLPLPGQSWRQMVGGQNKQMERLTKPRHNNRAEWPEWAQ